MGIEDLVEHIKIGLEKEQVMRERVTPALEKIDGIISEFAKELGVELARSIVVQQEAERSLMSEKEREKMTATPIVLFGFEAIADMLKVIEQQLRREFASNFKLHLPEVEN